MERIILHCDLNNFYASVECRNRPELAGLPVAVCGSPDDRHGVVLAKNQLAKAFGVATGEALWQARIKCPTLVTVPPHFGQYLEESRKARAVYGCYTDLIEPYGIDECWLDVTGSTGLFGTGEEMAHKIRTQIKRQLGLTISVGVSYNKIFAKLGSDLKKPDAVTVITAESFRSQLWGLPVTRLLGVGRAVGRRLKAVGVLTIGDLAACRPDYLERMLGKNGRTLWFYANGLDHTPVLGQQDQPPVKSVGNSVTCTRDLEDDPQVWRVLLAMSEKVAARLRQQGLRAGMVVVQIKDEDFHVREYSARLEQPTHSAYLLAQKAQQIFQKNYDWQRRVRAAGIRACALTDGQYQLSFDSNPRQIQRAEALEQSVDRLRSRYGNVAVQRAVLMAPEHLPRRRGEDQDCLPAFCRGKGLKNHPHCKTRYCMVE